MPNGILLFIKAASVIYNWLALRSTFKIKAGAKIIRNPKIDDNIPIASIAKNIISISLPRFCNS